MTEAVSIYARFDTEEDREDWFDFHILPETSPSGGPVFSWSNEDESGYRDLITELVVALEHAQGCVPYPSDCHAKIVAALTKAKGAEK